MKVELPERRAGLLLVALGGAAVALLLAGDLLSGLVPGASMLGVAVLLAAPWSLVLAFLAAALRRRAAGWSLLAASLLALAALSLV